MASEYHLDILFTTILNLKIGSFLYLKTKFLAFIFSLFLINMKKRGKMNHASLVLEYEKRTSFLVRLLQ